MSSDLELTIEGNFARRAAMTSAVSSTESVVWVMKATLSGSETSSASTSSAGSFRTMLPGGAAAGGDVDFGDQRAGGVDRARAAGGGVLVNRRGDAVGGEDDHLALGHLALLLDEDRAALGELLDHVLVVDDLLADVDGGAVELERPLDGLHGPV